MPGANPAFERQKKPHEILWLRGVYRAHVDGGVTLSTTPDAMQYAVIPTLSLNFSQGVDSVDDYVRAARKARSTLDAADAVGDHHGRIDRVPRWAAGERTGD